MARALKGCNGRDSKTLENPWRPCRPKHAPGLRGRPSVGTPLDRIRPYRVGVSPSPQFSRAGNSPAKGNVIAGYGRNASHNTHLLRLCSPS